MRKAAIVLLFFVICLWQSGSAEERHTIDIGKGSLYRWTPDARHLSFFRDGSFGLYSIETGDFKKLKGVDPSDYYWLSPTKAVFFESERVRGSAGSEYPTSLTLITIDTVTWTVISDSTVDELFKGTRQPSLRAGRRGSVALRVGTKVRPLTSNLDAGKESRFFGAKSHFPPLMRQKGKPVYDDADIWLLDEYGNEVKRVTTGKKYILPELSPNGTLLSCNNTEGGTILIIDTSGNEIANLGQGDGRTWSPTGDAVYFCVRTDDGHRYLTGDLFLHVLSSGRTEQLTFSPGVIENGLYPSPDGKWGVYTTEGEMAGHIYLLLLDQAGEK